MTTAGKVYNLPHFNLNNPQSIKLTDVTVFDAPVIQVATDYRKMIFLTARYEVYVFGENDKGQLGLGHNSELTQPEKIENPVLKQMLIVYAGHAGLTGLQDYAEQIFTAEQSEPIQESNYSSSVDSTDELSEPVQKSSVQ